MMESSAKGAFRNIDIDPSFQKEKQVIQSKMQKGNFRIGDEKNRSMQFETTYKQSIATDENKLPNAQINQDQRKHLSGSINLGSHQNEFLTEAKAKFIGEQGQRDHTYQNMIDKNRGQHFQFGDGQSQQLTSIMKSQFDYKGNSVEIRQTLDDQKKADLKTHHFSMGSHAHEYQTSYLKGPAANDNQLSSANQNGLKFEAKSLLKNSGQRIFGGNTSPAQKAVGGNSDYKTTNQSFIKWIQPAPSQNQLIMGSLANKS